MIKRIIFLACLFTIIIVSGSALVSIMALVVGALGLIIGIDTIILELSTQHDNEDQ